MIYTLLLFLSFGSLTDETTTYQTPAQLFEIAEKRISEGQHDKARDIYLSISPNDTSYVQAQSLLMNVYNELNQYQKSIDIGLIYKDQKSKFRLNIYLYLGNAYLNLGDQKAAINAYQEGVGFYPYSHVLLYNIGYANYKLENYEEAFFYLKQASSINPYYYSCHILLGYISVLQGHLSKAFMSYMTALAISPDNNSILVFNENLAALKVKNAGSITPFDDNSDFAYYDDLIRSGAALDSRFQTEVEFNASIVRQLALFFSKLNYDSKSDDFWMKMYVPFYSQFRDKELIEAFTYYILQSVNQDPVTEWLSKNQDKKNEWIDLINITFKNNRSKINTTIDGETRGYTAWYFNNNFLSAIGDEKEDETRLGAWEIFYASGQLSSTGRYDNGTTIGVWKYFHENGELSRVEKYDDKGNISEPAVYYDDKGRKTITAEYVGVDITGNVDYYYACGQLKERVPYTKGLQNGEGISFYNTGELNIKYSLKDNELNGEYNYHYKNGQQSATYEYNAGELNGGYKAFYHNGEVSELGKYMAGLSTGEWVSYYPDNTIKYKGNSLEGNKVGEWKFYYANGNLEEVDHYDESGELHGNMKLYQADGALRYDKDYDHGKLVRIKILDRKGNTLFDVSNPNGDFEYKDYYFSGEIKQECKVVSGEFEGQYLEYHRNGKIKQEATMVNNLFEGEVKDYYQSGQLKTSSTYKEGDFHGKFKSYFSNGKLEQEGCYYEGNLEGEWVIYFPDGSISEELYYISNEINGWNYEYAPGKKLHKAYFQDMGTVVKLLQYDTLGDILKSVDFQNGNGVSNTIDSKGNTTFTSEVACGIFVSDMKYHYAPNKISSITPIKNSEYNGEYKFYDPEGNVRVTGQYNNNLRVGNWKRFYRKNHIKSESNYVLGSGQGPSSYYYFNGKKSSTCVLYEGNRQGPCVYFDQLGNPQLVKFYDVEDGVTSFVDIKSNDTIEVVKKGDYELKSYFPNGKLAVLQTYKDGQFHGPNVYYNQDGSLSEKTENRHGQTHGIWNEYYSDGKLWTETPYQFDMTHGDKKEYYENGKLYRLTSFWYDVQNGYDIIYNEDGSEKSKIYYWNGEVY